MGKTNEESSNFKIRNKLRNRQGITLVALVVTIVVLLILAGITLTYVLGDNSVFKQASDAKINTELGKIEERAGLIYSDKLIERVPDSLSNKPTMQEIIDELRKDGYTIEQVAVSDNEITGISLDRESINLTFGASKQIKVTLEGISEPYTYYAVVDGKYYKMHYDNGLITIDRIESDISDKGEEIISTLTAIIGDNKVATIETNNDTNIITVTANDKIGETRVTVTYGSYTKICNIKVCDVATELEINSVRARIATGYTRWLNASAKPDTASQEFEWSSSNTSIATVDNKGVVTAKKAGKTTITVKTEDGSNLSKACEVTIVEDAPDVATLTDFQEKNIMAKDENGNLITIPGNFKVLTSLGTKVTDGIVIQDKDLNEFVWVPVDSVSTGTTHQADDIRLGRYTFAQKYGTPTKIQDADNYTKVVTLYDGVYGTGYQELVEDNGNKSAKDLGGFVAKTQENGGYYIARYEASKGTDNKVKSQYDKVVWAGILQTEAADYSKAMYNGSDFVESDLVNSYAWDTAIVFIQKYSGNSNYVNKSMNPRPVRNSGKSNDVGCYINDMALNLDEFTTEHSNRQEAPAVLRVSTKTTRDENVNRNTTSLTGRNMGQSFRPILYIK